MLNRLKSLRTREEVVLILFLSTGAARIQMQTSKPPALSYVLKRALVCQMKFKLTQAMDRLWDCDCIQTSYYTLHNSNITVNVLQIVINLPKAQLIFKMCCHTLCTLIPPNAQHKIN